SPASSTKLAGRLLGTCADTTGTDATTTFTPGACAASGMASSDESNGENNAAAVRGRRIEGSSEIGRPTARARASSRAESEKQSFVEPACGVLASGAARAYFFAVGVCCTVMHGA